MGIQLFVQMAQRILWVQVIKQVLHKIRYGILFHLLEARELLRKIDMKTSFFILVCYLLCACAPIKKIDREFMNNKEWFFLNHAVNFPPFLVDLNSSKGRKYIENSFRYQFPLLKQKNFVYKDPVETVKILKKIGYEIKDTKIKKVKFHSWESGGILLLDIKKNKQINHSKPLYAEAFCFSRVIKNRPFSNNEQCYVSSISLVKAGLKPIHQ